MSGKVHDFGSSLAAGEADAYEPFWAAVYRSAFPDFVSLARNCADNMGQRLGVDRYVNLSSGKTLRVDVGRRRALLDAADLAEEHAWADALACPPEESNAVSRLLAHGRVQALTLHAESLRVLAALALEGGR